MNFCDPDIGDYNLRTCGFDFAGIVGIGMIGLDESPNESELQDINFWQLRLIDDPQKYFVIRNTRGEYEGGKSVDEEDLQGTRVVGALHESVINSTNMLANSDYWNAVQYNLWKICLVNTSGLLFYVDKPVSVYTKINNAKSTKTQSYYETTFKWYDLCNPVILEAPEGLFFGNEPIITQTGLRITDLGFRVINTGDFRLVSA